ncbi:hypothetical protein [Chengkuizengella sediminis]|uniref:hypothetical protein n=1 Tax=Chengkuizengella sediminis TaxID=1885917 RepID=UPI00138A1C8A|nr:hypothetical protein [Chengkuizengella sediminis]NDI36277.1 hypothetical protein [Chengkuizengella sediminis]
MNIEVKSIENEKEFMIKQILIFDEQRMKGTIVQFTPHSDSESIYEYHDYFSNSLFDDLVITKNEAIQLFDRFNGKWEFKIAVLKTNRLNIQFWRSTISSYTEGDFEEYIELAQDGDFQVFKFYNDCYRYYMKPLLKIYGY